jgi:hypothetical protein
MKSTTLRVDRKTLEEFKRLGEYGDSMDSIIQRLIAHYKKGRKK